MTHKRICLQAGNIRPPECLGLDNIKVVIGSNHDWSSLESAQYFSKKVLDQSLFDRSEVEDYDELEFQRCLNHVFDHQATRTLYERDHTLNGLTFADADIERIVYNVYVVLRKYKIDTFIAHNTPHQTVFHVFGLVADCLGIPTYSIRDTALWWRVTLERGLTWGTQIRLNYAEQHNQNDLSDIQGFIDSKRQSYDKAITEKEERILKEHSSQAYPTKLMWQDFMKDSKSKGFLRAAKAVRYKLAVSDSFKKYAVSKTDPGINQDKYVLFYLHYQPERTTLPEGGIYNQQILAIRSLRRYLPADMSIVVKEHPATFRYRLHAKYRNPDFYKLISEIDNTFLIQDLMNDFKLMDKATFVSSIRGTVLIEAAIRTKCIVYFANAPFKGMPGAFYISELPEVDEFLKKCRSSADTMENEMLEYLTDLYKITVGREVVGNEGYSSNDEYWSSSVMMLAHILENPQVLD